MKAAGQPFLQIITPEAAGTIGLVAGLEACLGRQDAHCVFGLAGAGRQGEPSVEARARYIQNVAEPADGPDVTMLCNAGEPHIAPRAEKAFAIALEPMARMAHLSSGCHAPQAGARPLSSGLKSRPDRPASARSRETQQPMSRLVPACSGAEHSRLYQGHGRPRPPQRPYSSGN